MRSPTVAGCTSRGARCRPPARPGQGDQHRVDGGEEPGRHDRAGQADGAHQRSGHQRAADDAGDGGREGDAVRAGEDLLVEVPLQRGLGQHLDEHGTGAAQDGPDQEARRGTG